MAHVIAHQSVVSRVLVCLNGRGIDRARAMAVVDAPAIAQLMQEVQTVRQQLQMAQAQLIQAKQALQSMTGDRGMEWLLAGITRNYLPTTWTQLTAAAQAGGSYTGARDRRAQRGRLQCGAVARTAVERFRRPINSRSSRRVRRRLCARPWHRRRSSIRAAALRQSRA